MAFRRSPVRRALFEHFGENVLRSDLLVSVPELGELLGHLGVPGFAGEVHGLSIAESDIGADYSILVFVSIDRPTDFFDVFDTNQFGAHETRIS